MQSFKSIGQFNYFEINDKIYPLRVYGLTNPNFKKASPHVFLMFMKALFSHRGVMVNEKRENLKHIP